MKSQVAIFPIRLQIDQDTLDFIFEFFSRTGNEAGENDGDEHEEAPDETFFSEFLHLCLCSQDSSVFKAWSRFLLLLFTLIIPPSRLTLKAFQLASTLSFFMSLL